jgi:hypothetical protein
MGHSEVLVGNKIVYFGGTNGKQCFSDLWVFDTATMTWLRPRTAGRPPTKSKTRRKNKKKDYYIGSFFNFFLLIIINIYFHTSDPYSLLSFFGQYRLLWCFS